VFVAGFIGSPGMSFAPAGRIPLDLGVADEVTVGVRPEHMRLWEDGDGLLGPLDGSVEYVEALGRETFLGVRHDDETRLVLCVDGRSPAQPGDRVTYGIVRDGLRFFDPESGGAIGRKPS
jgi:ABC-type sugar transport system ATPase subunit